MDSMFANVLGFSLVISVLRGVYLLGLFSAVQDQMMGWSPSLGKTARAEYPCCAMWCCGPWP